MVGFGQKTITQKKNYLLYILFIKDCVWHSIIGNATLITGSSKKLIDQWVLIAYGIVFALMQVTLVTWLIIANRHVRDLKKQEMVFLKNFLKAQKNNQQQVFLI